MSAEDTVGIGEGVANNERPLLTAEMVWEDLNSHLALERMAAYRMAKNAHGLWLVIACSDARVSVPFATNRFGMMVLPSVAASALPNAYRETIKAGGGIAGVMIVSHFDGEASQNLGHGLEGCGGIHAKSIGIGNGNGTGEPMLDGYIASIIPDSDTVGNTVAMWEILKRFTDKPVVGAVMDHRTQLMLPVAIAAHGREDVVSGRVVTKSPEEGFIDHLSTDQLAELSAPTAKIFSDNHRVVGDLGSKDPEFRERQRYNDPRLLLITDSPKPARVLLPNQCDGPNESFRVSMPRRTGREGLTKSAVRLAIAQAAYPIMHAIEGIQKGSGSFSHLKTVLIHTKLGLDAAYVYESMREMTWMQTWMQMGGEVILVETFRGLPEAKIIYKG